MGQALRYRIIKDRDRNCPVCEQSCIVKVKYKRVSSYQCMQCGAIIIRLDDYYKLHPDDRRAFENNNEIKDISHDNSVYRYECEREMEREKERQKAERRKHRELEARKKEAEKRKKEEEKLEKKQMKVNAAYGDGPLGNLPKQRKRGWYS